MYIKMNTVPNSINLYNNSKVSSKNKQTQFSNTNTSPAEVHFSGSPVGKIASFWTGLAFNTAFNTAKYAACGVGSAGVFAGGLVADAAGVTVGMAPIFTRKSTKYAGKFFDGCVEMMKKVKLSNYI